MTRLNRNVMRAAGAAALLLSGCAVEAPPAAAQPYTMQGERALHPNMARAIDQMYQALHDMEAAPDNFGGNKAAAMESLRHAIHLAKRALYFRLRMDDRALDAIQ